MAASDGRFRLLPNDETQSCRAPTPSCRTTRRNQVTIFCRALYALSCASGTFCWIYATTGKSHIIFLHETNETFCYKWLIRRNLCCQESLIIVSLVSCIFFCRTILCKQIGFIIAVYDFRTIVNNFRTKTRIINA